MSNHVLVANEILRQLGGNRAVCMIGAKNLAAHNEQRGALSFRHMKSNVEGKPVNYFKVVLNEDDTYDVEFGWIRGTKYTVRKSVQGIYNDQLQEVFQEETKLYLTL